MFNNFRYPKKSMGAREMWPVGPVETVQPVGPVEPVV